MVLAQLRTGTDVLSGRGVALDAQGDRQCFGTRDRIRRSGHCGTMPIDQFGDSPLGERANRLLAVALGQEVQRGHRQIVVGVPEPRPSRGGEQE